MAFIRLVSLKDSKQILDIYSEYVRHTSYTFEVTVPPLVDFTQKIKEISEFYPYIVYVDNNVILGYAYANKHRERAAYCYNVDVSIYVKKTHRGEGIGSKLYKRLFEILKKQGFYNAFAGICLPNMVSEKLHMRYEFKPIGIHEKTGYKFEKWHDVKWMQKKITDTTIQPSKIKSIQELFTEEKNAYWEV